MRTVKIFLTFVLFSLIILRKNIDTEHGVAPSVAGHANYTNKQRHLYYYVVGMSSNGWRHPMLCVYRLLYKFENFGYVGSCRYAPASVKYIGVDFYAIGHTLLSCFSPPQK